MKWINKFKGNQKKIDWFIKQVNNGKLNRKIPELNGWELTLIDFYSFCVNENGLDISGLKICFESINMPINHLFYETVKTLSRINHYMSNQE